MSNLVTTMTTIGSFQTNCYTVSDEETGETIIIDPAERGEYLINMYEEQELKPVAILLTHGHIDHIGAIPALRQAYPDIRVYAGKEEKMVLESTAANLSEMFGKCLKVEADIFVDDNEILDLIGRKIRCIHVPGHTIGGMCYYFEDDKVLFSGDTLFNGSVGRSDFPTGNAEALLINIEEKLLVLPEEVTVYPGHNGKTTIKREKTSNPYF